VIQVSSNQRQECCCYQSWTHIAAVAVSAQLS